MPGLCSDAAGSLHVVCATPGTARKPLPMPAHPWRSSLIRPGSGTLASGWNYWKGQPCAAGRECHASSETNSRSGDRPSNSITVNLAFAPDTRAGTGHVPGTRAGREHSNDRGGKTPENTEFRRVRALYPSRADTDPSSSSRGPRAAPGELQSSIQPGNCSNTRSAEWNSAACRPTAGYGIRIGWLTAIKVAIAKRTSEPAMILSGVLLCTRASMLSIEAIGRRTSIVPFGPFTIPRSVSLATLTRRTSTADPSR